MLAIFYNSDIKDSDNFVSIGSIHPNSKVDIPKTSKKLPLLLARLAYVFEIYDEELKDSEEFEDFVDDLKGIRIKKEIQNHDTTLEEISGVLYLIDEADSVNIFVGDIDEDEMENLEHFAKMFKKIAIIRE